MLRDDCRREVVEDQDTSRGIIPGFCSAENVGADHVDVVAPGYEGPPILLDLRKLHLERRAFDIGQKRSRRFVVEEVDEKA